MRKSVATLRRKADKLYSQLVRKRAANHQGLVFCVTCGKADHWKYMDAGHFVNRRHTTTRYDDRNVHPQCRSCNRFNEGEGYRFGKAIDRMYGEGTAQELIDLSRTRGKFTTLWYESLIEEFKLRLEELGD